MTRNSDRAKAIFSRALDDLEGRLGCQRSCLRPEDLFDLALAADRAASPFREADLDLAGLPVRVCDGVWFWRLTFGASVWLDEVERMLGGALDERYRLALVYAVAHARNPDAFAGLDSPAAVRRACSKFLASLCATPDEVNAALDAVLRLRPTPRRDNSAAARDFAAICARLEAQTGIPQSEWVWKRSSSYALKCYADLHEFASAYSAAARKEPSHMRDELDEATEALNRLKVEIARRLKSEN